MFSNDANPVIVQSNVAEKRVEINHNHESVENLLKENNRKKNSLNV